MSENANATLNHPTIEGVTQTVPADAVDDWKEAGWLDPSESAPKAGTKDALVLEAQELGLSTEGNKADLEQRIADAKAQQQQ